MTLRAVFDFESGRSPLLVSTHDELSELVARVIALSEGETIPSIVEIGVDAENPYAFPALQAGIGPESGFVYELWNPSRATAGDPEAGGTVLFDYSAHAQEIPARHVVPLSTVRSVLTAYLDHGGFIPADFPALQVVED
ncbi:Imm1 family immunity protein [Nocardia sp. NRRL S-836]|uniref:Imm1 family immunity protein n=1 Tax=Nocardia sp. NRRL S-836 TaxID=1519492 RepID=UPI0018D1392E|nr:Imm1 family immunity protein [Nocardia sp. NRRL S-836]